MTASFGKRAPGVLNIPAAAGCMGCSSPALMGTSLGERRGNIGGKQPVGGGLQSKTSLLIN